MKRKNPFVVLVTALLFMSTISVWAQEKPNFLFILIDDMGYMDLGCNNPNTFYETPNIDNLANEGVRFTNAYAACPVCSPTRSSILTGKYPARTDNTAHFGAPQPDETDRLTDKQLLPAPYSDKMELAEITIPEALKAHDYLTFFAGKWHLGSEGYWPEDQGFDINKGGWTKGGPYGGNKYFSPYGNPRLEDGPAGEHLPDRLVSETIDFMTANVDKPFFAYLSFYSVHTPLQGRSDLITKYNQKKAQMEFPFPIFGQEGDNQVRLVQEHTTYAAMVEAMDLAVGRVLDKLEELGLDDNTVVILMSDNGGLSTAEGLPTSNIPYRAGKGWLYEGGIREPMIIKWPGETTAGTVEHTPVTSTDFYPTILEMAGVPLLPTQHADGVSLASLLKSGEALSRENIFWHYPHWGNQGGSPGAAIRQGDYKLIEYFKGKPVELYNLNTDPGETNNLADDMPEKVQELETLLHEWQTEVDAKTTSINPNYEHFLNDKTALDIGEEVTLSVVDEEIADEEVIWTMEGASPATVVGKVAKFTYTEEGYYSILVTIGGQVVFKKHVIIVGQPEEPKYLNLYLPFKNSVKDEDASENILTKHGDNEPTFISDGKFGSGILMAEDLTSPIEDKHYPVYRTETDFFNINSKWTLSLWMRLDQASDGHVVLSQDIANTDNLGIFINVSKTNALTTYLYSQNFVDLNYTVPVDGNWHHIVMTVDNTVGDNGNGLITLYADNVKTAEISVPSGVSLPNTNTALNLFAHKGTKFPRYNPGIRYDEFMIFDGDLTPEQVTKLYNNNWKEDFPTPITIHKEERASNIMSHPNPFNNHLTIELSQPGQYKFTLTNITGVKVNEYNRYLNGDSSVHLSTNVPKGYYILTVVKDGAIVHTEKVLKQ